MSLVLAPQTGDVRCNVQLLIAIESLAARPQAMLADIALLSNISQEGAYDHRSSSHYFERPLCVTCRCEVICEMLRGQELLAQVGLCESE